MENKTVIYGASDDLLEIDGDFSEEIGVDSDEPFTVGVSDGTLLEVEYDGEWKFRTKKKGSGLKEIIQSVGDEGTHEAPYEKYTSYSDLVILHGEIKWVTQGTKKVTF